MTDTPTSIADRLRAKRDKLTAEREPKLFKLPGYENDLQVKYRILTRDERKEIMASVLTRTQAGEERSAEMGMCRTLGTACLGFYTERDGKVLPLNEAEDLGDDMIRWGDERLAALFNMEIDGALRARQVIEYVLATDDVLEMHHNEVSRWMQQVSEADDEDF